MTMATIRQLRQARGMTMEDLASESGVSYPTVQRAETGQGVSLLILGKIARALEIPVRQLDGIKLSKGDLSSIPENYPFSKE